MAANHLTPTDLLDAARVLLDWSALIEADLVAGVTDESARLRDALRSLETATHQFKMAAASRYGIQFVQAWEARRERP